MKALLSNVRPVQRRLEIIDFSGFDKKKSLAIVFISIWKIELLGAYQ